MIKPAVLYEQEIIDSFKNIFFNEKYKYLYYSGYGIPQIENNTFNVHQFASVDNNNNLVGFIYYDVDRTYHAARTLCAVNFTDNYITFGADLVQVIKDIFEKYHFHKLIFNAVIGNPAREKYTKIIERFGGRIVGIAKEDIYMYGKYHDKIIYEVLKSDYDNMKEKNGLL